MNGYIYVGNTSYPIEERLKQHFRASKSEKSKGYCFYEAINLFGEENFYIEEIDHAYRKSESKAKERAWIKKLHTWIRDPECKGYNTEPGGDSNSLQMFDYDAILEDYLRYKSVYGTAAKFGCDATVVKRACSIIGIDPGTANTIHRVHLPDMEDTMFENQKTLLKSTNEISKTDLITALDNKYIYNNCIWLRQKDYIPEIIDSIVFRYKFERGLIQHKETYKNKASNPTSKYDYEAMYKDYQRGKSFDEIFEKFEIPDTYKNSVKNKLKQRYNIVINKPRLYQLTTDRKQLNIFDTYREANIFLGKSPDARNIQACVEGRTNTAYGFIWERR